jgi:hypothetical protein
MIVTLDGGRLELDAPPGITLGGLVDQVRARLGERLVVSVAVNGHPCGEQELESGLNRPLTPDDQVDLESGDRYAITADALRGLAGEIVQSGRRQAELAAQLGGPGGAEAIRQVGELVEVWQTCRTVVVQCSGLLGRDLATVTVAGRSVQEGLCELVEKLHGLRGALEARDLVLLADLLTYELPALCASWHDLLMLLAENIEDVVRAAPPGAAAPAAGT